MKRFLLTLLAAGSIVAANAQKHTILLYGSAYYNNDNQDYGAFTIKNTSWGINPGVGYQFNDHWTAGVQGSFGQAKIPAVGFSPLGMPFMNPNVTNTTNDWTAGAFLRYTKYTSSPFFLYGQVDLGYAAGNSETDGLNNQSTYSGFQGLVYPGIGAFVAKGLAINFNVGGIGYRTVSWSNNLMQNENKFVFNFGHQFTLGISKNFGCGHMMRGHHEPNEELRNIDTSDDDADDDAPVKHKKHHHKKKHEDSDDDGDE